MFLFYDTNMVTSDLINGVFDDSEHFYKFRGNSSVTAAVYLNSLAHQSIRGGLSVEEYCKVGVSPNIASWEETYVLGIVKIAADVENEGGSDSSDYWEE
jgi:hypothetical protein